VASSGKSVARKVLGVARPGMALTPSGKGVASISGGLSSSEKGVA